MEWCTMFPPSKSQPYQTIPSTPMTRCRMFPPSLQSGNFKSEIRSQQWRNPKGETKWLYLTHFSYRSCSCLLLPVAGAGSGAGVVELLLPAKLSRAGKGKIGAFGAPNPHLYSLWCEDWWHNEMINCEIPTPPRAHTMWNPTFYPLFIHLYILIKSVL